MTIATNAKASITQRPLETAGLLLGSSSELLPRTALSSYGTGSTGKVLFINSIPFEHLHIYSPQASMAMCGFLLRESRVARRSPLDAPEVRKLYCAARRN